MCLQKKREKKEYAYHRAEKSEQKNEVFLKTKSTTLKMRFSVYCVNVFTVFFVCVLPNYMVTKRNRRKEKEEG